MSSAAIASPSPATVIERTYAATIEEIWALWTTREGIESWWGPEGFATKVHKLDLRPGGEMRYTMTVVGAAQKRGMQEAGLPLTTEARLTFNRIALRNSIFYTHRADFIPGVAPYDVPNTVEFHREEGGVRVVVNQAPMHCREWTERARMGMESQLDRIPQALGRFQPA
jgi:hypothetical protein